MRSASFGGRKANVAKRTLMITIDAEETTCDGRCEYRDSWRCDLFGVDLVNTKRTSTQCVRASECLEAEQSAKRGADAFAMQQLRSGNVVLPPSGRVTATVGGWTVDAETSTIGTITEAAKKGGGT